MKFYPSEMGGGEGGGREVSAMLKGGGRNKF